MNNDQIELATAIATFLLFASAIITLNQKLVFFSLMFGLGLVFMLAAKNFYKK